MSLAALLDTARVSYPTPSTCEGTTHIVAAQRDATSAIAAYVARRASIGEEDRYLENQKFGERF
jgi:hypothetical protein